MTITNDVVFNSSVQMHSPSFITSTLIVVTDDSGIFSNVLILKLNPEKSPQESLEKIEEVFAKHNPSSPFEYQFADEEYARKFEG